MNPDPRNVAPDGKNAAAWQKSLDFMPRFGENE
jgi:hypothetical protein